ncbi:hypothetical protein UF68_1224 [Staphylococcus warneri]|nr:hypothetical protein AQ02_1317 [Staphylococcus warneri Lyso 1 2011]KEK54045.1 hypothetical protein AQ03_1287 [Staphylococcus warneri Lyso 2 2011]KKI62122.1 hypothetical protein UF68_1224 [Staphylococcus warneri]
MNKINSTIVMMYILFIPLGQGTKHMYQIKFRNFVLKAI